MSLFTRLLVSTTMAAAITTANADHVGYPSHRSGEWTFHPTYVVSGSGVSITSFLALRDMSTVTSDNLVAVWFRHDPVTGWSAYSWTSTDPWTAINQVKSTLSIYESDDRWATPGSGLLVAPAAEEAFAIGVLLSDPLSDDIPIAPDPELMVNLLVSNGYPAADLVLQHLDGCKVNDKLDTLALVMAEALTPPTSTQVSRAGAKRVSTISSACDFAAGIDIIEWEPYPTEVPPSTQMECEDVQTWIDIDDDGNMQMLYGFCIEWSVTQSVIQKRSRMKYDPTTGSMISCDELRYGTRVTKYRCCDWIAPFPPCPPEGSTPEEICGNGGFSPAFSPEPTFLWGPWIPVGYCPF